MKKKVIAGILALALVATACAVGTAETTSSGPAPLGIGGWFGGPCEMDQLTDEEREAIQQQLQEYEQELLAQHGIVLTDEQMDALEIAMQEQREAMREERERQREEQQHKLQALLAQYGIDLTAEERQEIQAQLREYRQELFAEYGISCPGDSPGVGAGEQGQNGVRGRRMQGFGRGPGFGECPPELPPEPTELAS